jgi:hypothetical protein
MANRIPPKTRCSRQFPELFCCHEGTAVAATLNLTSPEKGDVPQLTYVVTLYQMYMSEFQQVINRRLIYIFHADFQACFCVASNRKFKYYQRFGVTCFLLLAGK